MLITSRFTKELEAKGYRKDNASRWRFEGPYGCATIPGVLLFFGSYPFTHYVLAPRYPALDWSTIFIVASIAGFVLAAAAALRALAAIPKSRATGKPMDRYECADPEIGKDYLSYVYADHDAKTYFVRPARLGNDN